MKNRYSAMAFILQLVICQGAQADYDPAGKEQFYFLEKSSELAQKYGYDKFCEKKDNYKLEDILSCKTLPYKKHVGMKGYFDTAEPVKTVKSYELYPVVLENGKSYYYVVTPKYGKFSASSDIGSLEQLTQTQEFKPEPLIPGSPIQLVSAKLIGQSTMYELSNGDRETDKRLGYIREICARYGNNPKLAELLIDMDIKKDEVDLQYFILAREETGLKNEAKLYIGLDDKKHWLMLKLQYYGDDWLFVQSYKVAADEFRWQSPADPFKRDLGIKRDYDVKVWEWLDTPATDEIIKAAKALADAKTSTIRFQGKKYNSDMQLTLEQKKSLKDIMELYAVLEAK